MNKIYRNISFSKKSFDSIICLDADLPPFEIFKRFKNIPILAADGASIKLYHLGIEPDYIIGDLDTLSQNNFLDKFPQEKIIHIPEQEHNDFEKVIMFAENFNYKDILIIGFQGGLLEHTLNNWSVLAKYYKKYNFCLYDSERYALPLACSFKINVRIGEIISLIPMTSVVLKTKNLKWNLNNEQLKIGLREGARNIAIKEKIYVEIKKGGVLVFIDSRLPYAPQFE